MSKKKTNVRIVHLIIFMSLILLTMEVNATDERVAGAIVLAEFNGGEITKADFDKEFEKIPLMYRSRYNTVEGRYNLLNSIVIAKIFEMKAIERGVDLRQDVIDNIERGLQRYYAMEYRRQDISDQTMVAERDIQNYYSENIDRFVESANSTIKHIMTSTEDKAREAMRLLNTGTDFFDVMNQFSENNFSKRHQGVIRNIRGNSYIPGVGKDEIFDNQITDAPLNIWQGPVFSVDSYHIFMVTERRLARTKPLSEVRDEIIDRLKPIKELELRDKRVAELKQKYNVSVDNEVLSNVNFGDDRDLSDIRDGIVVHSQVEGLTITVEDLRVNYRQLSPQERSQMNNPQHLNRMLSEILENSLFAFEAKQKGYSNAVMENQEAQQIRRNTILNALFDELVIQKSIPDSEQIEAFYRKNINNYTSRENRTVQVFIFDKRGDARKARSNIVRAIKNDDEEMINEIANQSVYSENNAVISGLLRDERVPIIGSDESIITEIWRTGHGEVSALRKDSSGRYFFVRVIEDNPMVILPLSQVEEKIVFQLTRQNREQNWTVLQEDLRQEYDVLVHRDRIIVMQTPEELFSMAEEAQNRKRFNEAIQYYDQIIEYHKNNDDDYKALFMKAFLLAEEMNQADVAVTLFEKILADYPHSDLHESAEFMIKSIKEGYDIFGE